MNFLLNLLLFVCFCVLGFVVMVFVGYNNLRSFSETIKESWSNIGVVAKKQASLINQLIDVVKGYQESEKLVMLKVSEDMTNTTNVAQMYQMSGMVLSSVSGLAEKFPELKADHQYQRLIDSIQSCETQLERARATYNSEVRKYNTCRSSVPNVFFASQMGFKSAPYLEFMGVEQVTDIETIKSFSVDDDGERLNALFGNAAAKLKSAAEKTVDGAKNLGEKARDKLTEVSGKSKEHNQTSDDHSTD